MYMYEYHSFYIPVFFRFSFSKSLAYEAFNQNYYTKFNLHVHNHVLEIKIPVHFKNTIL